MSVSFTKGFLIAVWAGIIYNILYCIAFVLALCLLFRPLQAYWLTFDAAYYAKGDWSAGREEIATPVSGMFSVVGDAYSTVPPLFLISRLSLPRRQKWALYALFSLGAATVVFCAIRTYYMWALFRHWDFTWTLWKAWLFGEFELWSAIYAASAPALKPFFKRFFDRKSTAEGDSRGGGKAVYVVRGDSQGKLGKVEKYWPSSRSRRSAPPGSLQDEDVELVGVRATSKGNGDETHDAGKVGWATLSGNHIIKHVEYDVERCASATGDAEAQPKWDQRWRRESDLQRSGTFSIASGPASRSPS
jgi:hypothetical protein